MKKELETKAVNNIINAINVMGFDKKEFCKLMSREHRYLQEEFTFLCLEWIRTCASDNYGFDGRNEYSHVISKELVKHFCYGMKEN